MCRLFNDRSEKIKEIRDLDDRPYTKADFEDMFKRLDKLAEEENVGNEKEKDRKIS